MAAFIRLTKPAKHALMIAQDEARFFNHPYVGSEHILLALIQDDGVAGRVLDQMGVQLAQARRAVEFVTGRDIADDQLDFELTASAKKVIEYALDEALTLDHQSVGTAPLLLGTARKGEGIAAAVLEIAGIDLQQLRSLTLREIGG